MPRLTVRGMPFAGAALIALACAAAAQTPTRVRGIVTGVDGAVVHVSTTEAGEAAIVLGSASKVTLVSPSTLAAVTAGSFIGTAAKTQSDGTLVAVEVHIFPDSMRGTGEGHRPFDLGPTSTMTNGTVGQEVVGTRGQTLTVRYKGGEKQIVVPPDAPVVAFSPGDASAVVKGAHVVVFTQAATDGTTTAKAMLVGKDGFVPPL